MSLFSQLLIQRFAPYGSLSSSQLAHLERHYDLLLAWNQRLNLTRIAELQQAVELHYCESLYLARNLPNRPLKIADIGSGPGFPGFPIAVFRPDCQVTLVESNSRKCVFLQEASRVMPNIEVVAKRAEELTEHFDWLVSRAVRPEDVIRLKIAPQATILGNQGVLLPWGTARRMFHVEL